MAAFRGGDKFGAFFFAAHVLHLSKATKWGELNRNALEEEII
jgi:hypothetical protein